MSTKTRQFCVPDTLPERKVIDLYRLHQLRRAKWVVGEAARSLRVDPKTLLNWRKRKGLTSIVQRELVNMPPRAHDEYLRLVRIRYMEDG